MQTADLIFVSISGLMADKIYNYYTKYQYIKSIYKTYIKSIIYNHLSVEMASKNSSKDEFETLHYLLQYIRA